MHEEYVALTKTREQKLARVIEECGEVIAMYGKCQRWGFDNFHPKYMDQQYKRTNEQDLIEEMHDLQDAIRIFLEDADGVN